MVLNAAVQMLREADELKQKILKFKNGTSMLQERTLWITQQQLQKLYQKVLVLDLDYALDKKVEQDLWNVGFKQQIEALQLISKDKKNLLRSEGQAMLSWVLQAAAGFYLCLLHQICTTLKLDLPFRRRASLLGCVEGWGAGEAEAGARMPPPAAARYICQHCLVHLGDLARYRQQLRVAHTFYRHALVVSAHSGQPYNQLALVAWRRGRRLAALYWHVRSLLVRAPFPPAPANLARTLAAAAAAVAAGREGRALPVLGESPPASPPPRPASPRLVNSSRLDSHTYINEFIRVVHIIYTAEQLDTASELVDKLNSSLTALIATNSFDSMTLIKMSCVIMWLVHATTEGHAIDGSAMTATEATAALLADTLAAGALLALLLPAYTVDEPLQEALPAVCVWAQWAWCARDASGHVRRAFDGAAWVARPQLWPALAHTLNAVARTPQADAAHPPHHDQYCNVPLPEDEELVGFTPLEGAHSSLRFSNHAAWDTYGGRTPDDSDADTHVDVTTGSLNSSPELERRLRAHRLVELGKRLADQYPEHITYSEEEEGVLEGEGGEGGGEEGSRTRFLARSEGGEQLSRALAALLAARDNEPQPPRPPPPPLVISEADFREKVREKRVGILKPQGSLERAREERALANTADNEEQEEPGEAECVAVGESGSAVEEEKREARRTRVNIAMAAIMRKQEEGNKQVKFVTPPATPELSTESEVQTSEKPKVIQPKVIKSLANLPVGRKTGGILSLKDKSAGYPHLVNADPEKKPVEEKKEIKQTSPQAQQRRQDLHQPQQNWPAPYSEGVRMNYSVQNPAAIGYNPNFNAAVNNQGIRLPVVNPKEIDVRTAAIQKQNSRQDLFQDGNKMGNQGYQMSGDKKNFLNDLPPRFANQYRHWQHAQENHGENKFRDDNFKANFGQPPPQPRPNWMNPAQQETLTPTPWWKPDSHSFLNYSAPPMNIPNFYSHLNPNVNIPYQNQMPQFNMAGQSMQQKPEMNYMQSTIGQQMPTLQNLVAPPNINPTMNLGTFPPTVGYDSNMYPQFNKFQPPMKMEKQQGGFEGGKEFPIGNLGYNANVLEMQQRNMSFGETFNNDTSANNMDHVRSMDGVGANTYSLFSGAPEPSAAVWGSSQHSHQSLWSGPGPSPLERLLEQQKQMRQPQPPPH